MAPTVRVQTDGKEPIGVYATDGTTLLIALSNVKIFVRRVSDSYFLDWSDDTFKLPGSVVLKDQQLVAVDNVHAPGFYHLHNASHPGGKFDFSKIANKTADDTYVFTCWQDGSPMSATNLPQAGELTEGGYLDFIDQAISDNATPTEVKAEMVALGLDHLISVNPGIVPPAAGTYIRQILDKLNGLQTHFLEMSFSYDPDTDVFTGNVWLESGNLVVVNSGSVSVELFDKDRASQFVMTSPAPDSGGVFKVTRSAPTGLIKNRSYYAEATVTLPSAGIVKGIKGMFTLG